MRKADCKIFGSLLRIQEVYAEAFSGEAPVLCKLKEIWGISGRLYGGNDRLLKKDTEKSGSGEYESIFQKMMDADL